MLLKMVGKKEHKKQVVIYSWYKQHFRQIQDNQNHNGVYNSYITVLISPLQ